MGVGTLGGAEAVAATVAHVARDWFSRHASDVLLKLDLQNAFNCVNRQDLLLAVRTLAPELTCWADFSYGCDSVLFLGDREIRSSRGVQQGDPVGPLCFALALQVAVERVQVRASTSAPGTLDFMVFYLDDGVLAGPADTVQWFLSELTKELQLIGLSINFDPGKTQVIPAAQQTSHVDGRLFGDAKLNCSGCFTLLGAPIGTPLFCETATSNRAEEATKLIQSLSELDDPLSAFLLLRNCASFCRVAYSVRTVPLDMQKDALRARTKWLGRRHWRSTWGRELAASTMVQRIRGTWASKCH